MSLDKWLAQQDSGDVALGAGVTTLAGGTMGKGLWDMYRDKKFMEGKKATRSYDDFIKKLKPGDVLFHRRPTKASGKADIGNIEIPLKETDFMLGVKGDNYYHPSLHTGKGKLAHSQDYIKGVSRTSADELKYMAPDELLAMRPKDQSLVKGALAKATELVDAKTPYKSAGGQLQHGLEHLAGIKRKTGGVNCGKDGLLCSEFVSETYPDIFKDRNASPKDMRMSKDLEFAARYSPSIGKATRGDKLLQYALYPALKTAKFAALAAGLGYGASELSKFLAKRKEV